MHEKHDRAMNLLLVEPTTGTLLLSTTCKSLKNNKVSKHVIIGSYFVS